MTGYVRLAGPIPPWQSPACCMGASALFSSMVRAFCGARARNQLRSTRLPGQFRCLVIRDLFNAWQRNLAGLDLRESAVIDFGLDNLAAQ